MLTSRFKKGAALAVAASSALTFAASFAGGGASADPQQLSAYVGVGSDTTQEVMNALAGFTSGQAYTAINTGAATGFKQLISFDALPPAGVTDPCITTKLGGPTFDRPNGSGEGVSALSRTVDAALWRRGGANNQCGSADVGGQIDFARSSSGPGAGASQPLTYIPFGRDALSFAYYRADGNPVTTLTRAQLNTLFSAAGAGGIVVNNSLGVPVKIIGCGIQVGSGTFNFWRDKVSGASSSTEATATATCNSYGTGFQAGGRLQENKSLDLKLKGDFADAADNGVQVVVGYSAANWIAQQNGAISNQVAPAGVGLGNVPDYGTGAAFTGTAPNLIPAPDYYSGDLGRLVYNVVVTASLGIDPALQAMFVGPTSAVCTATSVINRFGFATIPSGPPTTAGNCGSTTLLGALRANPTS